MNSIINNDRSSCSSAVDPELNPATAAVDQLEFFPDWEFKRVGLLSERDEDFGGDFGEAFDEYGDHYVYDVQILDFEKLTRGAFSMKSLSRISESISREYGRSARTNPIVPCTQSPTDIKDFYSTGKTARGHDDLPKKNRTMVRCIACGSRLSQLDSSPPVTIHERGCSSISRAPSRRFSK